MDAGGSRTDLTELDAKLATLAQRWRDERAERHLRRHLDPADFDALRSEGFLAASAPVGSGGAIESVAASTRGVARALRTLAGGDPLVAAMHPSVIGYWLATPGVGHGDWEQQRTAVFASAVSGSQWGTITSEPGSGGDISRTRTVAVPDPTVDVGLPGQGYRLSGQKHFGSGSGVADLMVTTAVPEGEDAPALFVPDTRDRSWDGSSGMRLLAEWDGSGMKATQSHAMALDGAPAVRAAYDGPLDELAVAAAPFISCLFCRRLRRRRRAPLRFSRRSPFAHWFEDVRALGFLRPPWGYAYDTLFVASLA